jgi:elongation factor G
MSSEPVLIEVAIEPRTKGDQEKMGVALNRLAGEDRSLRVFSDPESGQTVIGGTGESQLEALVERMKREFKVEANVGVPQVAHRETITRSVEQDYAYKKWFGPRGEYAKVSIRFEPLPPNSGFIFENEAGGAVPQEYVSGVEKGLKAAKENGVIAGFPMIDFKATLTGGSYHEVDSSIHAFDVATRACYREGIVKAGPKLLEPIMRLEVVTPDECMGDIIGDLNRRRGQIDSMDARGDARVIGATAPLTHMFGFASALRSISRGRAHYTMHFVRYAPVPRPEDDGPFSPAIGMCA